TPNRVRASRRIRESRHAGDDGTSRHARRRPRTPLLESPGRPLTAMELSIVVPVYRSADCLPQLAQRVQECVRGRFQSFELILVNDASPDASWQVIGSLAATYPFVVGLNLRKNVGQDNAIMAGLHHATGDTVVIMDDDLQHDPADIPALR